MAVPAVLKAIPTLNPFSQLCALEFIQTCDADLLRQLNSPSVVEVLVLLLESDCDTVRQWTIEALAYLQDPEAIAALLNADYRAKQNRVPPDWGERIALRDALIAFGVLTHVVPDTVKSLSLNVKPFQYCWSILDMETMITALAQADQVILFYQYWRISGDSAYGEGGWSADTNLDADWATLVERSYQATLHAAHERKGLQTPSYLEHSVGDTVVTIEWIGEHER